MATKGGARARRAERGGALEQLAREKWRSSGLDDKAAKRLGLEALTGEEVARLAPNFLRAGALRIPYFDAKGKPTEFYRVRYLERLPGFDGLVKKPQRYAQPAGTVNEVYLPPLMEKSWAEVFKDTRVALCITEGEFKAACATAHGFPTIGLGGVDVWRSQKRGLSMLPDLEEVDWKEREVFIVYDSDAATNPDVLRAQRQLARALVGKGAVPKVVSLPQAKGGGKQGLDDFLVAHGEEAFQAELDEAAPLPEGDALWAMNEEVAFVRDPVGVLVRETGKLLHAPAFATLYANRWFDDYRSEKVKRVQTAKRWLEWSHRFEVAGVTYRPGAPQVTADGEWNLWAGWGVEPCPGDIQPWRDLLAFLFDGERAEVVRWFEQWCAYPLQNPGAKLHSAVVLWSLEQGVGKSLLGYILMDIYGSGRNAIEIGRQDLHAAFNSWAHKRQFVMGSEITGSEKRAEADQLKSLITQREVRINEKFCPPFTVPDCINYFFTSNHPNAFQLDESDRRFFIHEVRGKAQPASFYARIASWLKGGGARHLFHHLLQLDLTGFNPHAAPPRTEAKEAMIQDSRSEVERWVADLKAQMADGKGGDCLAALGEHAQAAELLTPAQVLACFGGESRQGTALGLALKRGGFKKFPRQVRCAAGNQWLWVLRNPEKWLSADSTQLAKHWNSLFAPGAPGAHGRRY